MSKKLGEGLQVSEEFELKTTMGGKSITIKEGTEFVVTRAINDNKLEAMFLTGEAKGKLITIPEGVEGIDYDHIADIIGSDIESKLEDMGLDVDEVMSEVIGDTLEEWLMVFINN